MSKKCNENEVQVGLCIDRKLKGEVDRVKRETKRTQSGVVEEALKHYFSMETHSEGAVEHDYEPSDEGKANKFEEFENRIIELEKGFVKQGLSSKRYCNTKELKEMAEDRLGEGMSLKDAYEDLREEGKIPKNINLFRIFYRRFVAKH